MPELWGGSKVALYGLSIENDGDVTISGGRFRLPAIEAGGDSFRLSSLEGELKSLPGCGYEIRAAGMFGMGGLPNNRTCSILVDVTIQTGVAGSNMLTISTPDESMEVSTAQASDA